MNTIPSARTAGIDETKVDVAIANRILAETAWPPEFERFSDTPVLACRPTRRSSW
jgi:hypothetical protein